MPGLVLYRFTASVIFYNAPYFRRRVLAVAEASPGAKWLIVDGAPIVHLDSTGADTIVALADDLAAHGHPAGDWRRDPAGAADARAKRRARAPWGRTRCFRRSGRGGGVRAADGEHEVPLIVARELLIVSALLEMATGLALLLSPPLVAAILLGASLDAPAAFVVGRMAGAALLSLGGACWLARNDGPGRVLLGLVAAMLLYNCVAAGVLGHAGAGARLVGILLWPAVALHSALAAWCIACLRSGPAIAAGR